jgi:SAM-dependent methyltransferase
VTFLRSAHLYDLLYDTIVDYDARVAEIRDVIRRRNPGARTLLDVGCGTGRYLERLRPDYAVTGIDIEPAMVEVCRARVPDVPVSVADMTDFDLGRRFDAVICIFGGIGYTRTLPRMRAAMAAMARHLAPGGVLVVDGWVDREQWRPGRIDVHRAEDDHTTVVRMTCAVDDPDPTASVLEFQYLVGTHAGIEHIAERHELGLFSRAEYIEACSDAGLRDVRAYDGPTGPARPRIVASAGRDGGPPPG